MVIQKTAESQSRSSTMTTLAVTHPKKTTATARTPKGSALRELSDESSGWASCLPKISHPFPRSIAGPSDPHSSLARLARSDTMSVLRTFPYWT